MNERMATGSRRFSHCFLGIGPPKTATTWVHRALSLHPDVSLPPLKEIGYLWEKNFLPSRRYLDRFFSNHWFYATRRRFAVEAFLGPVEGKRRVAKTLWWFRYSFLPRTDKWYTELLDSDRLSGDVTPKYCELKDQHIEDARRILGKAKIIITARDPVERDWSRAKMNLCQKRGRLLGQVADHEWFASFDEAEQVLASDYAALRHRWERVFGDDNVALIFFDDIQADPLSVATQLSGFLGLSPFPQAVGNSVRVPANVGAKGEIPHRFRRYLFEKHRRPMERFAIECSNSKRPTEWIRRYGKEH